MGSWALGAGAGFVGHPDDPNAPGLFQPVVRDRNGRHEVAALLAAPPAGAALRGIVVTCPGAGGGPGPNDPLGGGGGGTYGGYNVYGRLAAALPPRGIAVLLVHYPGGQPEAHGVAGIAATAAHLVAAAEWALGHAGIVPLALVGWSMGGAVVIEAAVRLAQGGRRVSGVATLAGQSANIPAASLPLPRRTAVLVVHGTADDCLGVGCAKRISARAGVQPRLLPGEDHGPPVAFALRSGCRPYSKKQT